MWQFQYKHGDRPLEGYTIQRAAGRGGFGEVYYAVSDSGREVALKAVTGYEQIELRGISQCMNLKNPHLVTVFDVKHNDQGRPFVLMEFVAGPSLRQLLDESPGGLGTQKAAFFLREIGKGLTYLHECGIVHRDLKPGNIFYENGYVKIGDYGLSKAIAPTQHSGQTITVGTVHYMAPEIGGGRYDKSIDIYALGAVLFEMIAGQPPFLGASAGEILLKHVSTEPDVSAIEEPFRTVIRKSMAKDPADRYQSVQEMIEAVFGSEHVQQSVSCFSPDSLSMVAERVAQRVAVGGGSATPPPIGAARGATGTLPPLPPPIPGPFGDRMGRMFDRVGDRLGAFGDRVGNLGAQALPQRFRRDAAGAPSPGDPALEAGDALCDPLSKRQRRVLGLIMLAIVSVATGVLSPVSHSPDAAPPAIILTFLATIGAAAGMLLAGRHILPHMNGESPLLRKLAAGGTASALMLIFGVPAFASAPPQAQQALAGTALALIGALLLTSPPDLSPSRRERLAFGSAITAVIAGFVINLFAGGILGLVVGILAGTHLLAQIFSPWDPFAAKRRARLEGEDIDDDDEVAGVPANIPAAPPAAQPSWSAAWNGAAAHPGDAPTMAWPPAPPASAAAAPPGRPVAPGLRPVPPFMRWLWLAGLVAAIPTGIALLVAMANGNSDPKGTTVMTAFGVGALVMGVLCLGKTFQTTFRTWWRYAFRWGLMWACVQTILFAAILLGTTNPPPPAQVVCIFAIVMPAILLPILLFVRFSKAPGVDAPPPITGSMDAAPPSPRPTIEGVARPIAANPVAPPLAASQRRRRNKRRPDRPNTPLIGRFFGFLRDTTIGAVVAGLLLLALMAAGWLAMDVPGMLAAGLPAKEIPAELTRNMGTDRWPQMFRMGGYVIGWFSLLFAAAVLIVARRRTYGLHMLRGVAGVGLFALSLFLLVQSARNAAWVELPDVVMVQPRLINPQDTLPEDGHPAEFIERHARRHDERMDAAVERYFRGVQTRQMVLANVVSLLSLLVLCWPARRNTRAPKDRPYGAAPVAYPPHPTERPAEQQVAEATGAAAQPK